MRIFRATTAVTASLLAALLMFGSAASAADAVDPSGSGETTESTQSSDEQTNADTSSESDSSSDESSGSGDGSESSGASSTQSQSSASSASTNPPTGVYAELSGSVPVVNGSPQPAGTATTPSTGTFVFPGIVNAPSGTYSVAPDGTDGTSVIAFPQPDFSAWIPADTPFGAIFGASGPTALPPQPVRIPPTATGRHLQAFGFAGTTGGALTTISFAKPMLAGAWGFALVGIDIENAIIGGLDANGNALSGAQLGGATFDLCNSADAPPDVCTNFTGGPSAAAADEPSWDAATSTCTGAGGSGATCWFRPSAAVRTITMRVVNPESGFVGFSLWLAALKANLGIDIGFPGGSPAQPVQVELFGPDGEFLGTQTVTGSGVFRDLLAASGYLVRIAPPQGFSAVDGQTRVADLSAGDTTVAFPLATAAPVHPTESHEVTEASLLPTTGTDSDVPALFAVLLLVLGGVLVGSTRRRFV